MQRIDFLASALAALAASAVPAAQPGFGAAVAAIETRSGGRVGIAVLETASPKIYGHRMDERLPLASTQKLPLVMTVLSQIDRGALSASETITITKEQLEPPYSEIAKRYPNGTQMTIGEICRLTISESDNTGADALARRIGGPPVVSAYLKSIGFAAIHVDRMEKQLPNSALVSETRDTTTPRAMAQLVARLAVDSPLSVASTKLLLQWMLDCKTGDDRLRAGVASGWRVADKTGTYHNAWNDVGLLFPPSGPPIAIAVYVMDAKDGDAGAQAIADCARIVTGRG